MPFGERCSSVVERSRFGAMGRRIDPRAPRLPLSYISLRNGANGTWAGKRGKQTYNGSTMKGRSENYRVMSERSNTELHLAIGTCAGRKKNEMFY